MNGGYSLTTFLGKPTELGVPFGFETPVLDAFPKLMNAKRKLSQKPSNRNAVRKCN
jgi:hypothetical protein